MWPLKSIDPDFQSLWKKQSFQLNMETWLVKVKTLYLMYELHLCVMTNIIRSMETNYDMNICVLIGCYCSMRKHYNMIMCLIWM